MNFNWRDQLLAERIKIVNKFMGLPGKKRTKSSKLRRAAHFALKKINLSSCPKCQKSTIAHRACSFCGTYRSQEVIKIKVADKKSKKKK